MDDRGDFKEIAQECARKHEEIHQQTQSHQERNQGSKNHAIITQV